MYIYADIGASKLNNSGHKYSKQKYTQIFWSMLLESEKEKGFEFLVSRMSNHIARKKFCEQFGA